MEPLATAQIQAYLFDPNTSQYEDKGQAGIAIVGQPGSPGTYRIGCYVGSEYLCTADITNNNDTGIQWSIIGTGYASFRDDQQRIWSISFPGGDTEVFQFSASVTVAMYGASNQPEGSVICCDVSSGKRDRIVVPNDKVKARYCSWVVQRRDGQTATICPRLGSQLESNENDESAYIYAAPLNHNSVTSDLKGFEGMTIGMAEESRRFIIVPRAARRGSGPNVHVCYMVYIVKKKDNAAGEVEQWRQMQQQQTGSGAGASSNNNNNSNQTPRGGNNGNGPITVVVQSNAEKKKKGALVVRDRGSDDDNNNNEGSDYDDNQSDRRSTRSAERGGGRGRKDSHHNHNHASSSSSSMPAPAPGFNFEQMDVVNRMRDQVANLLLQIKEATSRVDLFSHDMRQSIEKSKPKSLGTAQMKHTLDSMLEETEQLRTTLEERDKTLRQLEDKNKDLQGKVDAFSATAARLSEEKKAALAETSQVRLDGDSKALSLQSELTRIMSEREDTSRHLSSVKRLLEISDADCNKEKQGLQTAEVQMTTIEAKMSSADEQLQEERGRRKLLESKITTLGDELRSVLEEIRVKESQIDERRRKMEADKLHYTQIMDEERNRAADEMRELRDELVQEITVRDRRYQEERGRVARESFERGRVQGIEDGHNEAAMEVDARMQTLVLETQRYRSEIETIKVRLAQSAETADASRRHQEAHCQALGRVVDELQSQIHASEVELRALESTRVTAQAAAADAISDAVKKLTRPVSRSDLLGIMHQLRVDRDKILDTTFEADREKEERERAAQEHDQVVEWVKRRVVAPIVPHQSPESNEAPPPLMTPWTEDVVPEHLQPNYNKKQQQQQQGGALQAEFLNEDKISFSPVNQGPARPDFVQDVERRQRELLQALHQNDPSLELIAPPKPPTPPPTPTPEPSEKDEEEDEQQQQEKHVDPTLEKEGEDDEWDEEEKKRLPPSSNQPSQKQFDNDDQSEDEEQQQQQQQQQQQDTRDEEEEQDEDDQGYGYDANADFSDPASKQQQPLPASQQHDTDEDEEEAQDEYADEEEAAAEEEEQQDEYEEEEEEESQQQQPPPRKQQSTTAAPASRQRALFAADDSDDSEEETRRPVAKKQQVPPSSTSGKKQPAAKPTSRLFAAGGGDDSDEDDSDEEESRPVFRVAGNNNNAKKTAVSAPASKPAAKPAAKKSLFAETDSDDDDDEAAFVPPPRKQPVAPPAGKKAMPAPKKSLFAATDSDDE